MTTLDSLGAGFTRPASDALGAFSLSGSGVQRRPTRRRRVRVWLRARSTQVRRFLVASTSFGLFTSAAFEWHTWAGLVAAGVSVLLVDHVVDLPAPDAGQSR